MNNLKDLHHSRREKLARKVREISGSGIVILETANEISRNRDSHFPYRHDSDFFYLTGFKRRSMY